MEENAPNHKVISGTQGYLFIPRLPESTHRLTLYISLEDLLSVMDYKRRPGYKGVVKDLQTQQYYKIYGAECDTPECYCDVVALLVDVTSATNSKYPFEDD